MITPNDDKIRLELPQAEEIPHSQFDESSRDAEIPQPQAAQSAQFPIEDKAHQPPPYIGIPSGSNSNSNITEAEWKDKLKKLEKKIRKYNWTKQGDEAAIVESMRDLAASHNDPKVQAYWTRRANEFEKAPDSDKKAILVDIARGLAILVAAPFAITGALFMGTGMLLKASANLLTGGSVKITK
ncbi:6PF2K domain-containing protein [Mycena venus]|uniref:6PF2K domain-containing protein n=1 Tax=Mycena venus TaxID=2733690 RepID=A0A8H6WYA9_9AGAR|nr:6PF2K domain-containing protein [Mycena venus]